MRTRQLTRWMLIPILVALVFTSVAAAADYWVDAVYGDDKAGNGSRTNPWKTITHALTQITPTPPANDTIHVMPGVYAASTNGETIPVNMIAYVTLEGTSARDCVIDGEQQSTSNRVVNMQNNAELRRLTIKGSATGWWDTGVGAWTAWSDWKVLECTITGNSRGIHVWDKNQNVTIAGNFFHGNTNDNLSVYTTTAIDILNNTFDGSLKGIIVTSNSAPAGPSSGRIMNNCITNMTQFGIDADAPTAALFTLNNNNLWSNATNYQNTLTPGANDISVDPQYAGRIKGNLHISGTSPLIDKGTTSVAYLTDWDGTPRPQGKGLDIGADELVFEPTPAAFADFHLWTRPAPGATIDFVILGRSKDAGAIAVTLLQQNPPIPLVIGPLHLNLATLVLFLPVGLDAQGVGTFSFMVPNSPALVGLDLYTQSYSGTWLTRYEPVSIR